MLWSGMCFKSIRRIIVVTKYNTYSNVVTYKCCRMEQSVALNVKGLVIL
jgi:hypothetical protein